MPPQPEPSPADKTLAQAWHCYDERRIGEAIDLARQACDHSPQRPDCAAAFAWFLLEDGRQHEAEVVLRSAIEHHPDFPALHWYLGLLHHRRKELEAARQALTRALQLDPGLDEAAVSLAWVLHDLGHFAEATVWSRLALSLRAKAETQALLGWLYILQEQFDAAVLELEAALRAKPELLPARCQLVSALQRLGRNDEAREILRQGLTLSPDNPELLLAHGWHAYRGDEMRAAGEVAERLVREHPNQAAGWHLLGVVRMAAGDLDTAEQCFAEVQERDASNVDAPIQRAAILRQRKRSSEAVALLQAVLRHSPDNLPARAELAAALADLGEFAAATALAKAVLTESAEPEHQARLGWLLLQQEQFAEAVTLLQAALSARPAWVHVRCDLVAALQHLARLDEAVAILDDGLAHSPDEPNLRLALGWLFHRLDRLEAARDIADELVKTHPDRAEAWHLLGVAWRDLGSFENAERCFAEVQARDPLLIDALVSRAALLRQRNLTMEAAATLRTALSHAPNHVPVQTELVNVLLDSDGLVEARSTLHRLLRGNPGDASLWHLLARIALKRRRRKFASYVLRRACRLAPDAPEIWRLASWVALDDGNPADAQKALDHVFRLSPDEPSNHVLAAFVFEAADTLDAAARHAELAVACLPADAEAWCALAKVRYRQHRLAEAETILLAAQAMAPRQAANIARQLGWVLTAANRLEEAEAAFSRATDADGEDHLAWLDLAKGQHRLGRFAEALEALARAENKRPNLPSIRLQRAQILADRDPDGWTEAVSICRRLMRKQMEEPGASLLLARLAAHDHPAAKNALRLIERRPRVDLYDKALLAALGEQGNGPFRSLAALANADIPGNLAFATAAFFARGLEEANAPADLPRQARQWYRQLAAVAGTSPALPLPATPEGRRLRVAYVAAHFHRSLLTRVLAAHDHRSIEVYLYCNVPRHHLNSLGPHVAVQPISGQDLAASMFANRIDVAVDTLGIHPFLGQSDVLRQFARRVAPVQCAWLGSWATGGGLFDVLIADEASLPVANEALYEEEVVRLPGGQWCWEPPAVCPDPAPPPCLGTDTITFGSVVRGLRLTRRTLAAWTELLVRIPGSRLDILGAQHDDWQFRREFADILRTRNVDVERVRYRPRCDYDEHLAFYNQIDIALDAMPANGGLCLIDALWMGVPFVTCAGLQLGERQGLSLLTSIGHPEWASGDDATYLDIAVALAGDRDRLARLRRGLRQEVLASPLVDGRRAARALEAAYTRLVGKAQGIAMATTVDERSHALARRQFSTWCAKQTRLKVANTAPGEVPDVSVVVVLFNQAAQALQTLAAVADQTEIRLETIIVDNASSDDTPLLLERLDGASVLRNDENLGFLHAANQGAALARGRHLLFLAGDAVLQPDALLRAVERLDAETELGAFEFAGDTTRHAGMTLIARRALWERVGGFDPTSASPEAIASDFRRQVLRAGYRAEFVDNTPGLLVSPSGAIGNDAPSGCSALRHLAGESRAAQRNSTLHHLPSDRWLALPRAGRASGDEPAAPAAETNGRSRTRPRFTTSPKDGVPQRTIVQSFDLFDTLIARACVTPANLFDEVGRLFGLNDFRLARMAAEQRTFATGNRFDLKTIYRELVGSGYCDEATADRLMTAEIEVEFDNAIPIVENIAAVRDYDLVVSDMYLDTSILRGLLQHVGLRRFVHLWVSNAGKHRGTIWPQLAQHWLILRHIGDNEHADVRLPQSFGIPTLRYGGARMTCSEQRLVDAGLPTLARIARQLRLGNPFSPGTPEAELWNHFVEFNVPLLCLAAAEARRQRDTSGKQRILFIARDCHFLSEVFLALYPGEPSELVHVSRTALVADRQGFADYLDHYGLADSLLCDLVSTGLSWLRFSQATARSTTLFSVVRIDNYQYQAFDPAELDQQANFRFFHNILNTELDHWSSAIEILNTAPHGPTLSTTRVGDEFVPGFDPDRKLPPTMFDSLIRAQAAAMRHIRSHHTRIGDELARLAGPRDLLSTLISALSGTDWLNELGSNVICNPTDYLT